MDRVLTREDIEASLKAFQEQRDNWIESADREIKELKKEIPNPTCDDLRPYIEHKRPINRCKLCWPAHLKYLGSICR